MSGSSLRQRLPQRTLAWAFTVLACLSIVTVGVISFQPQPAHAAGLGALSVSGNQLLAGGSPIVLRGVNRSGSEYACEQGFGFFDGPSDQASVAAMASWGIKSVRVPLNEDCWLGINGAPAAYSGQNYINAIVNYVNLLHSNGMYAEITDMWSAPGSTLATSSPQITNADHSPTLWTSVANAFKTDPYVFFGLMNEPHGVTASCWLNGGSACSGQVSYTAAGSQSLVTAIRNTGATQPIAVQCIDYANNCTGWLANKPVDPDNALIAEAHIYGGNTCQTTACLDSQVAPVAAQVPVIFGETGETFDGSDCNNSSANISAYMTWADSHNVGYQAWTWDTWGSCNLSLITDYNGTPFGVYGTYVKNHLLAEAGSGQSAPSITSFSPTSGPVGSTVTLTGVGFTGATAVEFNLVNAPSFTVNSDTSITVTVPSGATNGRLTVVGPGGSSASSQGFTVGGPGPAAVQHFPIAMGFDIGWAISSSPPWGSINEDNLFGLQTTNGSALDDSSFLTGHGINAANWAAAAHAHNALAMITIGGSSDQNWHNACAGTNQAPFIANLVNYMKNNGFDGIDLDIEDNVWAAVGPPNVDMTSCVENISNAAKATLTQAGHVPIISGDVITNWEGGWWAPSVNYVDQFNLMTYGDTIAAGNLAADDATTVSQGLPANKFVNGIDVVDAPSTNNQCGPFMNYAQTNGQLGAMVWEESQDQAGGYPCFNQFASYLGSPPPPAPIASLTPSSLAFGNQQVGTTSGVQVETLTNTGNAALSISGIAVSGTNAADFVQTNNCPASLAANANCTVNVTFTPSVASAESASLQFTDNAADSPQSVALSGTGTSAPAPAVSLSPSSLAFGNQQQGTSSAQQTVTLTNSGNAALSITSIGETGTNAADFAESNNCPVSLAAGANCSINVVFTPSTQAAESASVSIVDNAADSPQSFAESGTGTAPPAPAVSLTPSSLAFGNQVVNTASAQKSVTLKNTGNAALSITSISEAGSNAADFAESNNCPASLAAAATCTINVVFTPSVVAAESANISIVDNAADSPQSVAETGTGVTAPSGLAIVQAKSKFFASGGTLSVAYASNVSANHLLVAVIDLAGGNVYSVSGVTDTLGNTWHKAVAGANGDDTDVEIWYTNSASAGADTITAAKTGSGYLQAYLTISEWNGTGTLDGHAAAASSGTSHSSGSVVTHANDLVVGGYSDAGYSTTLSISDGKTLLGAKQASTVNQQAIQSYGTASGTSDSVKYGSGASAYGEVAAASFSTP